MFRLQRYFSTSSLVIILITAVILGTFYRYLSINLLLGDGENRNVAVTRLLANGLWDQIEPLLAQPAAAVAADERSEGLNARIQAQIAGGQVLKIKLYSPEGMTLFSTDRSQIGEDQRGNAAIARAMAGEVSNSFVRRDQFNPFDRQYETRDLLQTYLPLRPPGAQAVVGVFEVYSDYTPLLTRIRQAQWWVMGGTGLILTLLYGALLLVVRHAETLLDRQRRQLQETVAALERVRDELEQRVADRTRTLQDGNRRLAAEVDRRRRMEQIVREREQRLQGVMDNLLSAILVTDAQGTIETANPSAERLFDSPRRALVGTSLLRWLVPERLASRPDLREGDLEQRLGAQIEACTETEARRRDGLEVPVELSITRYDQEGSRHYIASFRDISDRRDAEYRLEQSRNKLIHQEKMAAIGFLSAGIVHEIGNPISAIDGLVQQLQEGDGSEYRLPATVREDLNLILEQTRRLIKINRDVAEFAAPQGEEELIDVNNLVGRTCRLLRYDDRLRNIRLELVLDQTLPALYFDGNQLIQVLMNLVANAADALGGREGGEGMIRVETRADGGAVVLAVEDNGCGMTADALSHALEPFFTTKGAGRGTGLGLSICHSIVSARGGEIGLRSTPGEGSRVEVRLPASG